MRFKLPRAALFALFALATVMAFATPGAVGAGAADQLVPTVDPDWNVPTPLGARAGALNVVVTLVDAPLAVAAKKQGLSPGQQRQYVSGLNAKQDTLSSQAKGVGAQELARVSKALNAVVFSVNSSKIKDLESLPGIASVRPISDYQLDLNETVPYIGAASVQNSGVDGTGVRVAVLDSGIDYTHRSFGGPGTAAAYAAAYGANLADPKTTARDGLFPTAKVLEGFDFVGEGWPTTALAPDNDPIDCGPAAIAAPCAGGHGSHVSDIIAGVGTGPTNDGVAPGAKLYMFKVCSARSTSCSGVALLQGVDAALDPNNDGDISDRADVVNLSLGSSYGQKEDDLSAALANSVLAGSVVVASAGNAADRPYITGSPSSTPELISVAQTQVPSAKLFRIVTPAFTAGGVHQDWSAAPSLVSGALAYDTTSASTRRGCTNAGGTNPWVGTPHAGKVLLIDRGTCAVSQKVANAASAGAVAAVIANNASQAPGDLPPSFSFGGPGLPPLAISGYTITQADGNSFKALSLGQTATIDPASAASLVMNMVASSSRGPSYSFNAIKPDIGAPGASVSAEAGTGTGGTAFGGTSGAAPMVAGSAALLLDKNPNLAVGEVKSLLMNTAETNIGINPVGLPGVLAPITRIGGGEVRVDKAAASATAAWDVDGNGASLSFGFHAIAGSAVLHKKVAVRNYGSSSKTYSITPSFRFANDAASGAVTVDVPSSIQVPAGGTKQFDVKLMIDASKLPTWDLNGGSRGGDGFRLQGVEFDGYVTINGGTNDNVHVAWHVLPHKAAEVRVDRNTVPLQNGTGSFDLRNQSGVLDGGVDVFSLTGTSGRIQKAFLPQPGDNFAIVDLRAVGVRQVGSFIQFGIDTYGARAHPNYPAEFDIFIDTNRDGTDDFVIFNLENGGFAVSGQNVVAAGPLPAGPFGVSFFTDADLNSGNAILTAPMAAVGLTAGTKFDFSVLSCDNYFTGFCTDAVEGMTYTLGTPRFAPSASTLAVPKGDRSTLGITSPTGGAAASPSQSGFLLMYRDAGYRGGNDPSRTEAEAVKVNG
ncbi:MAG: hypothetical protein HW413_910 [Thermoleophilia bacterium]|nr:hypothetical protein [Thermoleophilia bacterium]